MTVFAYTRVSTQEQAAGLEAQEGAIRAECDRRGWSPEFATDHGYSARDLKRPGIQRVLASIRKGDTLVVAKLDRLSRSVVDFAGMLERARRGHWSLVVLDLQLDTTTPMGEAMAHMAMTFAQFERRMIGLRTKEALAVKREQGIHTGRSSTIPDDVRRRVHREFKRHGTYAATARALNAAAIPTGQGGAQWWPSSVKVVVTR